MRSPRSRLRLNPVTAATPDGATWTRKTLTTWGRARYADTATLPAPGDDASVARELAAAGGGSIIAYGSGRCYGDGALNSGGRTLLTRARCRIELIDREAGVVVAQSGASFDDLSAALHPIGFTYPVAAATGAVTLGGALVNDLHAKNHHSAGSFGRHVMWFDLLLADGCIVRVDREGEPELFAATLGGLGLTGIVLRVALRMAAIRAPAVDASYRRIADIDEFLDAIEPARLTSSFWFGWIDALAGGKALGRGILETGVYAPGVTSIVPPPKPSSVPFALPRVAPCIPP